jgi:hypothetical protein
MANVVCRNLIGCFASVGLFILAVAAAISLEQNFLPYAAVTWVVALAGLGVVVVNVIWRSRRLELNDSLCLDCRARRGR